MEKSSKFLRNIVELIETGLISSKQLKKELENLFKFRTENIINKLNVVSREEFEVQKEIIMQLKKDVMKIKTLKTRKKKKKK